MKIDCNSETIGCINYKKEYGDHFFHPSQNKYPKIILYYKVRNMTAVVGMDDFRQECSQARNVEKESKWNGLFTCDVYVP